MTRRITTTILTAAFAAMTLPAQTFTTLHHFGAGTEGAYPTSITPGTDGNYYGTAFNGGGVNSSCLGSTCGTIFKLTPNTGATTAIYTFFGSDGGNPNGPLLEYSPGNFIGTTFSGGAYGYGTIFTVSSSGVFNLVHSCVGTGDCALVSAGFVKGADGNYYGASAAGGTHGNGALFEVDASTFAFNIVYSFLGGAGGTAPGNAPTLGQGGWLYGTAAGYAVGFGPNNGVIYAFNPGTHQFQVLAIFQAASTGGNPCATPIIVTPGVLMGLTTVGGQYGAGTVFGWSVATGGLNVTYDLNLSLPSGYPSEACSIANVGSWWYGSSYFGGTSGNGEIFRWQLNGTTLQTDYYDFPSMSANGASPYYLTVNPAGNAIIGVTYNGGAHGEGTAFRLVP